MKVWCPYCDGILSAKELKPGRYRPVCQHCGERFFLELPDPTPRILRLEDAPPESASPGRRPSVSERHPRLVGESASERIRAVATSTAAISASSEEEETFRSSVALASRHDVGSIEETAPLSATALEEVVDPGETAGIGETALFNRVADTQPPPSEASELDDLDFSVAEEKPSPAALPGDAPRSLGGYRIEKELGRGAMGAVYLARQVSLDRPAALKVIQRRFAQNPIFVNRFVREAYAAAQLTHHNVVQIYDMGEEDGVHFFSMEFVRGRTLEELLEEKGRLTAEAAAALLLQACRGLKFAHDSGMVHRDVKPANVLLNEHGIVKIADLGLVKTSGDAEADGPSNGSVAGRSERAAETQVGVAMGTPAYMAPEQAEDASSVDHRADIYSLGCTLYAMLTGRPPFHGTTVREVISKHLSEPAVRPDAIVQGLPRGLSEINMRMVAKDPDDRYQSLEHVIEDLEEYLGVRESAGSALAGEEADRLASLAESFQRSARSRLRTILLATLAVLGAAGVVAAIVTRQPYAIAAAISLCVATPLAYLALRGFLRGDPIFDRVRALAFESRFFDWLALALVGSAVGAGLGFAEMLLPIAASVVASIVVAAVIAFGVDRFAAAGRRPIVEEVEGMLRRLRVKGVDDARLRDVVVQAAGGRWEEFFEALFGYDAKILQRARGVAGCDRTAPKFGAWRDPLIRRLDAAIDERRRRRETTHLARLEAQRLAAEGMSADRAYRQALESAEAVVENAEALRRASALGRSRGALVKGIISGRRAFGDERVTFMGVVKRAAWRLLSPKLRFVAGLALIVCCVIWIEQNGLFSEWVMKDVEGNLEESGGLERFGSRTSSAAMNLWSTAATPAAMRPLFFVPEPFDVLFDSLNVALTGILLVASCVIGSKRGVLLATLGAAIAFLFVPLAGDLVPVALPSAGALPGLDAVAGVAAILLFAAGLFVRDAGAR